MKNIRHSTFNPQPPKLPGAGPHWMCVVGRGALDVPQWLLILAIRAYQLTLSPALTFLFGGSAGCRFKPTCSAYALDALREHGAVGGAVLAAKRVCRCHPWGGCGHDPVPEQFGVKSAERGI